MQSLGEEVTFRGNIVLALQINRAPGKRERERYNFGDNTQSVIALPIELETPTAGEIVVDQFGKKHRIQTVHSDFVCALICGCTVSTS